MQKNGNLQVLGRLLYLLFRGGAVMAWITEFGACGLFV